MEIMKTFADQMTKFFMTDVHTTLYNAHDDTAHGLNRMSILNGVLYAIDDHLPDNDVFRVLREQMREFLQ